MAKTPKDLAVDEAKKIAKIRAGWRCEKCGKTKYQTQLHGAHIMPVTYSGTAADPRNILCLCAGCHSMGPNSAHQQPQVFVRWMDEVMPGRYEEMREIALEYSRNPRPRKDWVEIREQLKEEVKRLEED